MDEHLSRLEEVILGMVEAEIFNDRRLILVHQHEVEPQQHTLLESVPLR